MAQQIFIVRHGNREDFEDRNWARNASRPHDPGLSPDGIRQAQELGRELIDSPIKMVFASPFLRTLQTAAHIAEAIGLPIHVEPGLGEILPTIREMPAILESSRRSQLFPSLGSEHEPLGTLHYPESEEVGHQRCADTVNALAERYRDQSILCVTHASPVVGIVRRLSAIDEKIRVPLCALFVLERANSGGWTLVRSGDVSHLSDQKTSLKHAHVG